MDTGVPHRNPERGLSLRPKIYASVLFSLAALSKETAIVTPAALALWEALLFLRDRAIQSLRREHIGWLAALLSPILPLAAWYAYHFHRTGFIFGNPEYLRYNATANLDAHRIALCLYHRLLHLTLHMNLFVPVLCAAATLLLLPVIATRARLPRPVLNAIAVVLLANWAAFSILGGALLTRYLLPMYPLVLLFCVAQWQVRVRRWYLLAAFSAAAFLCGLWINPPYAFAPEDNLTYRNYIILHQRAVALIAQKWPQATVLTAWPATSELERPELGYTKRPIKAFAIQNFSFDELEEAANDPGDYDTALLFSTKWAPPPRRHRPGPRQLQGRRPLLRLPPGRPARRGRCNPPRRSGLAGRNRRRVGRRPPLPSHRKRQCGISKLPAKNQFAANNTILLRDFFQDHRL